MNTLESADERWRPILGVEQASNLRNGDFLSTSVAYFFSSALQVLVSVLSMLSEPNIDSPANIDAAKMFREDTKAYRRKVRECVERSLDG